MSVLLQSFMNYRAAPVRFVSGSILTFIHKTVQEYYVCSGIMDGITDVIDDTLHSICELEKYIKKVKKGKNFGKNRELRRIKHLVDDMRTGIEESPIGIG